MVLEIMNAQSKGGLARSLFYFWVPLVPLKKSKKVPRLYKEVCGHIFLILMEFRRHYKNYGND